MSQPVSRPKFSDADPELAHFETLCKSARFSLNQTRMRDLRPQQERFNLPPLYEQEEKIVGQLEALDARFLENLRNFDTRSGKGVLAPAMAPKPEQVVIQRALLQQKSRARIEKLKDLQSSLDLAHERLMGLQAGASRTLIQLKSLIQSAQSQLTATYAGQIALSESDGMGIVRPYLVKLVEKLDCLQPDKQQTFVSLCSGDAVLIEPIKAPNALPVLEKAALLALGQTINQVLEQFLALLSGEASASQHTGSVQRSNTGAAQAEAALQARQHQPSLQLLQRACRSHEEILKQLQAFHGKLGQPQQQLSLGLLKRTLQQLRNRSLQDLQVFQDVTNLHLPALSPLKPLLQHQQERLAMTCTPDFLSQRQSQTQHTQVPDTPDLPEAFEPLLVQYVLLTDKVLVAFEALTAQTLEKEHSIEAEGNLADLDGMFDDWGA